MKQNIQKRTYITIRIHGSTKKGETNPTAREPRVVGERQTDGYRTCSDLSQCYKAQLDRFTEYKWTHLKIQACSHPRSENVGLQK